MTAPTKQKIFLKQKLEADKSSKNIKQNNNHRRRKVMKKGKKKEFKFEGQSSWSKNWFALEDKWLKLIPRQDKIIFTTEYFNDTFLVKTNSMKNMHVTIGSAKKQEIKNLHLYVPTIKYVQHDENTCCFSILASSLFNVR